MRARRFAAAALAVAAAAGLSACSGSSAASSAGTSFVAGNGAVQTVPAAKRQAPVQLSGTTLTGSALDLASLRGKPVVVNVWGSWCSPCRREAPDLQQAADQLAPAGVKFVGIDIRDDAAQAKAFLVQHKITYPSLSADDDSLVLAFHGVASPSAVPTTLVLDAQGRVAARVNGMVTTLTLVQLVQDVAAGR